MQEIGSEQFQPGPQKPEAAAKSAGVEGAVSGNSVVAVTAPDAEQTSPPKKEGLSASEKLKLKEAATAALKQLIKAANQITSAPDYAAALGVIPSQADIKSSVRFKAALRQRLTYFHPDRANIKVAEILGDVGKFFPELADQAHSARLACEEASKKLSEAESFLRDDSRRAKYLAEKYGIQAGAPEGQRNRANAGPEAQRTKPRAERTNPGSSTQQEQSRAERTRQAPDWVREARESQEQGFKDWRDTYASDAWQEFARTWDERRPPAQATERPKTAGKRVESLLERIKEAQGQSRLKEMVQLGVEALKEVKDMVTLKLILELVVTYYDLLKKKYPLKENKGSLPNDIAMFSLKGMLSRLNRKQDANERWETKQTTDSRLQMLVNSASIILNYLQPKPPFGGPFGATA